MSGGDLYGTKIDLNKILQSSESILKMKQTIETSHKKLANAYKEVTKSISSVHTLLSKIGSISNIFGQ